MKRLLYISILFAIAPVALLAQDGPKVFSQDQMLWYVQRYHPVALQAGLLQNKGESEVRMARGAFDPYVQGNLNQKEFEDKTYFSLLGAGLKIPTWFGVELKGGYDQNAGVFLNPENTVPQDGLWFAGVSVPIGKGLFMDKRRAALRKAQIYAESTKPQQQQLMNELYFEAISEYWKWVEAWNRYLIYQESVELASTRFNAVKQNCLLGDKPAIDTLEAFIQLQNRQIQWSNAQLNYQNQTLELSNYLWFENTTPLQITDSLRPPGIEDIEQATVIPYDSVQNILSRLGVNHPALQLYDYKLERLEIDRRLKLEGLKPQVNLNYQMLSDDGATDIPGNLSPNNYKYGLELSYPIFVRQQRGALQLNKLETRKTQLGQTQKLKEIQAKVLGYYNALLNLNSQVALYKDATNNYQRLLSGERKKFDMGESSLFLVNSRESKLIETRLKLTELITKYNQSQSGVLWAAGQLFPG